MRLPLLTAATLLALTGCKSPSVMIDDAAAAIGGVIAEEAPGFVGTAAEAAVSKKVNEAIAKKFGIEFAEVGPEEIEQVDFDESDLVDITEELDGLEVNVEELRAYIKRLKKGL